MDDKKLSRDRGTTWPGSETDPQVPDEAAGVIVDEDGAEDGILSQARVVSVEVVVGGGGD
jgi:hypothetical protein